MKTTVSLLPIFVISLCLLTSLGCSNNASNKASAKPQDYMGEGKVPAPEGNKTDVPPSMLEKRALELGAAFDKIMFECPQRIWPQENFKNIQIVLTDQSKGLAWIWNDQNDKSVRQVKPIQFQSLPASLKHGLYGFEKINGSDAVAIDLNQSSQVYDDGEGPFDIRLTFHEGFHHFFQTSDWNSASNTSRRGDVFPVQWKPRYYRRMLLRSLYDSYVSPDSQQQNLGASKYWYEKWKQEYPKEAQNTLNYDQSEGSANYVEHIASALSALGCQATEDQIYDYMSNLMKKSRENDLKKLLDFESEYYHIGLVSGLLLRKQQRPNWEKTVMNGKSLVETLLDQVDSAPQADSTEDSQLTESAIEARNKELAPILDPFVSEYNSKDVARIVVPYGWKAGSYSTRGFFWPSQIENTQVAAQTTARFESADGNFQLIATTHAMFSKESAPCQGFGFLLSKEKIVADEVDGTVRLESESLKGKINFKKITDPEGFDWYCPIE